MGRHAELRRRGASLLLEAQGIKGKKLIEISMFFYRCLLLPRGTRLTVRRLEVSNSEKAGPECRSGRMVVSLDDCGSWGR